MRSVVLVLITACGRLSFDPVESDVSVGFTRDATLVDEASGTVAIPVQLTAPAEHEITVAFDAGRGTATSGVDFTASGSGTLVFAPGVTEQTIELAITADGIAEPDEMFDLTLAMPEGATLASSTHTITISAAALPRVGFEAEGSEGEESGSSVIAVVLDAPSSTTVTVDYELEANDDYTLRSDTITFEPGQTRVELELGQIQDALDEGDDLVVLVLAAPVNAVLGDVTNHVHTIVDDDPVPVLGFAATAGSTLETGTFTFTVELSAPSGRTVSVIVVRGNLGAEDVEFEQTMLTFEPGETSKQLPVLIVADTIDEPDEQFEVQLVEPTNAIIANDTGSQTVTIIDDDPPPTVNLGHGVEVNEDGGQTALVITLSHPSAFTITVPFSVSGDSTASPNDFTIAASPLTFESGVTERELFVDIVNDTADEANETIRIGFGTPTNATLDPVATSDILIIDDDDTPPGPASPVE